MTHIYACYFCKKVACDLTSLQYHSTPLLGRFGIDIYDCSACGVRYYFEVFNEHHDPNKTPYKTTDTRQTLLWLNFSKMIHDVSINETQLEEEKTKLDLVIWEIAKRVYRDKHKRKVGNCKKCKTGILYEAIHIKYREVWCDKCDVTETD